MSASGSASGERQASTNHPADESTAHAHAPEGLARIRAATAVCGTMGNSMAIKTYEKTPLTMPEFARIAEECRAREEKS